MLSGKIATLLYFNLCFVLLSTRTVRAIGIMSKRSAAIRVVSYNVLSSHLASPSHFTQLNPEHLEAAVRLPKILAKLENEISRGDNRVTVFCLQEVSYQWAGKLHTFFANKGYHVTTGLYGRPFNGYMGVLTAWPTDKLEVIDVDINRLSDTAEAWPEKKPDGLVDRVYKSFLAPPLQLLGLHKKEPESHWDMAKRRFNVLLTATLKDKVTQQAFCIGNYHMPCVFTLTPLPHDFRFINMKYAPMVMTMHADMCIHHVQALAAGSPYIIAGDFNIKPADAMYKYLVTGQLDPSDPAFPATAWNLFEWKPSILEPVRSAYAVCLGEEPDFTNYARVGEQDPFIDTLDYIFLSPSIKVAGVTQLPKREEAGGPFPNEDEPSDHVLIAADVDVGIE